MLSASVENPLPSTPPALRPRVSVAVAVVLACAVLLPLLGHRPLTDWDEGIYAEIAREMLNGGPRAWLVPHWNGQLWFEKPPLLMWLQAASLRVFGVHALAARLPSALAGVAIVGALHGWMLRRLGVLAAWLTTLVLLCAFGFQHAARAGETDTLLSLGCLIAMLGLAEVMRAQGRGWWWFWAGFAAALMTKGAASAVLPMSVVVLALTPSTPLRWGKSFWQGLLLFLCLVLPWHSALASRYGRSFLGEYLGFHVLSRATAQIEGHVTHPWFYLWVLLVSAPPFALLYPVGAIAAFRRPELAVLRPLAVFACVELVLFSAVQTRLPHYIAPVYPAGSALAGTVLAGWLTRRRAAWWTRPRMAGAGAGLVAAFLLSAAATSAPRRALHSPRIGNGLLNPDNRESVTLLERSRGQARGVPGPLLVLRSGPVMPLQTLAFYAQRRAQPIGMEGVQGALPDRYNGVPAPLNEAVPTGQSRLMLLDSGLAGRLGALYDIRPLAKGSTQTVAVVQPYAARP